MWNRRNVNFLALILISLALLGTCAYRNSAIDRFDSPRRTLLGDDWLHMTAAEKTYFVEGYQRGNVAGHTDACGLFTNQDKEHLPPVSTPSGIVLDPCQGRVRNWSKGTEELVKQIDAFYSRFSSDRGIHVTNLIQNLSDQSGLTIEQIHATGNH